MTVNTISNTQVLRGDTNGDILTFVECAGTGHSGDKDNTVDALANRDAVNRGANVQVRVFAANDTDILSSNQISDISYRDTLIKESNVLRLTKLNLRRQSTCL